jgi:hypothetical protein
MSRPWYRGHNQSLKSSKLFLQNTLQAFLLPGNVYTPLAMWFIVPARLYARVSTTARDRANSDVSSKEGAVIGAVLSTRKSESSGDIRHMNNCRINVSQLN